MPRWRQGHGVGGRRLTGAEASCLNSTECGRILPMAAAADIHPPEISAYRAGAWEAQEHMRLRSPGSAQPIAAGQPQRHAPAAAHPLPAAPPPRPSSRLPGFPTQEQPSLLFAYRATITGRTSPRRCCCLRLPAGGPRESGQRQHLSRGQVTDVRLRSRRTRCRLARSRLGLSSPAPGSPDRTRITVAIADSPRARHAVCPGNVTNGVPSRTAAQLTEEQRMARNQAKGSFWRRYRRSLTGAPAAQDTEPKYTPMCSVAGPRGCAEPNPLGDWHVCGESPGHKTDHRCQFDNCNGTWPLGWVRNW
jgi:hypothetical protein